MEFKRVRTNQDRIDGILYNSFYKTGFVNEEVYDSKARDIFPYVLKLLTDTNTASVFENIAVAYQEVEYSERVLQQLLSREFKDAEIHRTDIETYVSIDMINFKFYKFLFIQNPSNVRNDKKIEIINTLKILKEKYSDFTLIPSVIDFLHEQVHIHTSNKVNAIDKNTGVKHLIHTGNIVTLAIPQLIDNRYYNTNGVKRYPYLTEEFLHSKTKLGQLTFLFKCKQEKLNSTSERRKYQYVKKESYFDVGEYTTLNGEIKEIFYVKLLNKFYNPFMFFDENKVNQLILELDNEPLLHNDVRKYLKNTYEAYIEEVAGVREVYGNLVPNIIITKENDSYYDDMRERLKAYQEMLEKTEEENNLIAVDDDIEDDCECDDDDEIHSDKPIKITFDPEEDEEEDPEEYDVSSSEGAIEKEQLSEMINEITEALRERDSFLENKKKNTVQFKLSRNTLSIDKLKSLIMGFNGEKKFAYYPHLADILLKYTDLNDVKRSSGIVENPKQFPKSFQIVKTIGNDELFCTDDSFNPIDWIMPFIYRKTLIQAQELGTSSTRDISIPPAERYLTKDEMGLIDPHTKKSETAAGLLASINPFITVKDRITLK